MAMAGPSPTRLRIGTRRSPLALAQANEIARRLDDVSQGLIDCEIVAMSTTGDRLQDRRLIEAGGKGLFTKELDIALAKGRVDLLVHSLKDVPVDLPEGQVMLACPEREDPRDAFVSERYATLDEMPEGAIVGTASLRRQAQTLARRPDLRVVTLRGNVQTRLHKISEGFADATFLAAAGLSRLGMSDRARSILALDVMLPAASQGIWA